MPVLKIRVEEQGAITYHFTLDDGLGTVVPLSAIASLTATLYPLGAPTAFINDRNNQDVLNDNGGAVHATNGQATLQLLAADNPIIDDALEVEQHVLLMRLVLANGLTRNWTRIVEVENLDVIT